MKTKTREKLHDKNKKRLEYDKEISALIVYSLKSAPKMGEAFYRTHREKLK